MKTYDDGLEDAAKACDDIARRSSGGTFNDSSREVRAAEECASVARSLKGKQPAMKTEREIWNEAIAIAKDYSGVAGSNAFRIRDRYGDEGANEEELEFVAQAMADKIVSALEAARDASIPAEQKSESEPLARGILPNYPLGERNFPIVATESGRQPTCKKCGDSEGTYPSGTCKSPRCQCKCEFPQVESPIERPEDKATPRPWRKFDPDSLEILGADGYSVADVFQQGGTREIDEADANAELIIAAVNACQGSQLSEEGRELLAGSICPSCDFAYSTTRYMPDNNCDNCIRVRVELLRVSQPTDTVEAALAELREMFPDYWVRIDRTSIDNPVMSKDVCHSVRISIDKFADDFEGATLAEAMAAVRKWKEE